jgi:hypothetical protein
MAMDISKAASKASDDRLRAALEAGDTASVQIDARTNKMRNQVFRAGLGKAGSGS